MGVTPTSLCPWLDRRVSDLILQTNAHFGLAFATPPPIGLSSPAKLTRGPIIQKVRSHGTSPLLLFVCIRFQVCFTPLSGFFSPFLHSTGSLSVDQEYLALEDGPPMFRQDFSCPALLKDCSAFYLYGAITRYGVGFQLLPVLTEQPLGCSPFARRY